MPPRKFDKNNSTTFSLVYRAQNDPRIHDADASDMVFTEKPTRQNNAYNTNQSYAGSSASVASGRSKIPSRDDLDSEFGGSVRDNEGEAAAYGIYYDDSEYDYMQHMRDMGSTDAYFIDAAPVKGKGKQKGRKLEDALRGLDLDDRQSVASSQVSAAASEFFNDEILPSEFVKKTTYQDMQDVPDAIAGFQPDMDPRLREVLEALEDEAYVEDDEEDIFGQLQDTAIEVDRDEFDDLDFDDEGWESDHTVKAGDDGLQEATLDVQPVLGMPVEGGSEEIPIDHGDGDWLAAFAKAKRDGQSVKPASLAQAQSQVQSQPRLNSSAQRRLELQSTTNTAASSLMSGRKKKRKGAMTSSSAYSMSSSVLSRTEGQSILDRRFDKIEEEYASDDSGDDDEHGGVPLDDSASVMSGFSQMSGMSGMSKMSGMSNMSSWSTASKSRDQGPKVLRSDFGDIMDDFLGNYSKVGARGKHVRKGRPATGMEQLDEVRKGLGPPRLKGKDPQKA